VDELLPNLKPVAAAVTYDLLNMRVAALDLGSNSFHALIAEVGPRGGLAVVERAKRMPRIGEAIFRTGAISDAAMRGAMRALGELVPVIERHDPQAVLAVATSAVREARNGPAFVTEARARFGLDVRVISGDEEACLSYAGARARLGPDPERLTLFDLGGGSLEMIIGEGDGVLHVQSAPLGVLRAVAERALSDPATPHELRALEQWARGEVEAFLAPARSLALGEVALCAGTARAVRAVGRALGRLPASGPGAERIGRDTLGFLIDHLGAMPLASRREVRDLDPGRADLIVHGAVLLDALLAACGVAEARVCRAALREGLILEHVARRPLAAGTSSVSGRDHHLQRAAGGAV
jgi:exopolyphosphatase/guanosine-5'-triphosphate,3'-diphosphate pyrophosphatase